MSIIFRRYKIEDEIEYVGRKITSQTLQIPSKTPPVFICVLNGGFMFYSDLMKSIETEVICDFIKVKSYEGAGIQREVKLIGDISVDITDKVVYIVDDIYDSGHTVDFLIKHLMQKKPKELKLVTMLKRASTPPASIRHEYLFTVGSEWVYGRGMNESDGTGRNLLDIYKI